eukprot:Em0006g215a
MSDKTVLIVGAGLAGLCAASLLTKHGITVEVLEAKERVGGRTYTINNWLDLGGMFVGKDKKRSLHLAKELGIDTFDVYKEGLNTFRIDNVTYHQKLPIPGLKVLSLLELLELLLGMLKINLLGKLVPLEKPWESIYAKKWDAMTTKEWIESFTSRPKVRTLLTFIVRVLLGVEPEEVSFLYFVWYIRAGHGMLGILTTAQDLLFKGGAQQLSEKLVTKQIGAEHVHLKTRVVTVECGSNNRVGVHLEGGTSFEGDYCILAVAPSVRNNIIYNPPLSGLYNQLPQRLPMGSIIKTFAVYEKAWWRDKGFSGAATVTDTGSRLVGQTIDITPPDGSGAPCIMGFVLGKQARRWQTLSADECQALVLQEYAEIFESDEALNVKQFLYMDWLQDKFTGGSGGIAHAGVLTSYGDAIGKHVGRLYFAGTETASDWSGYMDGAIQSGWRAAKEILDDLKVEYDDPEVAINSSVAISSSSETPNSSSSLLKILLDYMGEEHKEGRQPVNLEVKAEIYTLFARWNADFKEEWLVTASKEKLQPLVKCLAGHGIVINE